MRAPDAGALVNELRYPSSTVATKRVLAKVCGVTTAEDAILACRAGADVIGVIHVPKSKRCVDAAQASDIVDAVRAFGEREARWAPSSHGSLDEWSDALRTATDRGRPLVFGVVQDQPLADVQKFVEESGVDVVQLHGSENLEYAEALQVPHARVLHAEPSENIDAAAADLAATYAQVASAKCCLVLVDARRPRRGVRRVRSPLRLARRRRARRQAWYSGPRGGRPRRGARRRLRGGRSRRRLRRVVAARE